MATFYLRTRTAKASSKRGGRACDYIAGEDKYGDKDEVKHVEDMNLPKFAPTAKELFIIADKNERANGRSYRSLVIAIPNEAPDPIAWAKKLVSELVPGQAGRLAVHIPEDGNPHLHFLFTERTNSPELTAKEYFSRSNKKNAKFSGKAWLEESKAVYLNAVREVAPDYNPPQRKEKKIGPKLKRAKPSYNAKREERAQEVKQLRADLVEVKAVSNSLAALQSFEPEPTPARKTTGALDRIKAKPATPPPPSAPVFNQATIQKMQARAEDKTIGKTAPKSMQQRVADSSTSRKLEALKREEAAELKAGQRSVKSEMDREFKRVWGMK